MIETTRPAQNMTEIIRPGQRSGQIVIPASKSYAHRFLILAALSVEKTTIRLNGLSRDITATADCLRALGAEIELEEGSDSDTVINISPIRKVPEGCCDLYCQESGSTLRFLLPVVGALGAGAVFHMEGRLPERPLAPLDEVLTAHGMTLQKENDLLYVSGPLLPGTYSIPGNVSSQYISGLLMALPLLSGPSTLTVTGKIESADYIAMTEDVLKASGIQNEKNENVYEIAGSRRSTLSGDVTVEADWSNAAFFLAAGALSEKGITVCGLNPDSAQGDRRVLSILEKYGAEITASSEGFFVKKGQLSGQIIDAAPIPDLVPVLSVVGALSEGETRFINASRLRLKESDRIHTTVTMLSALGADIREEGDDIVIHGRAALTGGTTESFNDHRIAMSAAVAATVSASPVEILDPLCIRKSYPRFYTDFASLEE